ncbi:MAG: transposase [Rubrobacteraceae bacterium]|nr:transposase [Rubrobacteraceae bacterium]
MNDGSKGASKMTAGVDLGDKYSYIFVLDNDSGEIVEEGRLRTTPDDLRRRFVSAEQMKIAIEVGTHSTWISRLLEECGHEVLIANPRKTRLIYGERRKTDKLPYSISDAVGFIVRTSSSGLSLVLATTDRLYTCDQGT